MSAINNIPTTTFSWIDSAQSTEFPSPMMDFLPHLLKTESPVPLSSTHCVRLLPKELSDELNLSCCFLKYELTRSIPIQHRLQLIKKISSLTEIPSHIERIQILLREGTYHAIEPSDFYYALAALFKGLCDESIVVRISNILSLKINNLEFETINLKKLNTQEQLMMLITMIKGYIDYESIYLLRDEIAKMDPIDCIVIELPLDRPKLDPQKSLLDRLGEVKFTCFHNPDRMLFLPTLTFVNHFLRISCKENAIEPIPRFGKTTVEEIRTDFRNHQHVIGCSYIIPIDHDPFSDYLLIESLEADSFYSPNIQFYFHDLYHVIISSNIPKKIRKLCLDSADRIRDFIKHHLFSINHSDRKAMYHITWELIDMDIPEFVIAQKENRLSFLKKELPIEKLFLGRILPIFKRSITSLYQYQVHKELESNPRFKQLFDEFHRSRRKKYIPPNIKLYISPNNLCALFEVVFTTLYKNPEFKEMALESSLKIKQEVAHLIEGYTYDLNPRQRLVSELADYSKKFVRGALSELKKLDRCLAD